MVIKEEERLHRNLAFVQEDRLATLETSGKSSDVAGGCIGKVKGDDATCKQTTCEYVLFKLKKFKENSPPRPANEGSITSARGTEAASASTVGVLHDVGMLTLHSAGRRRLV